MGTPITSRSLIAMQSSQLLLVTLGLCVLASTQGIPGVAVPPAFRKDFDWERSAFTAETQIAPNQPPQAPMRRYSSGGNTAGNTTTPSSATTPSAPAPPTTITQAITFPDPTSRFSFVGVVKSTYELAYGKAIGIFNTTSKSIKHGSTVTSTAARRASVVTFVATVPSSDATAATTAANGMTAASYKTALDATIVTLNVTVTAHTPTNVATAVITGGATTSGAYKTPASVLMALVLSFLVAAMH